MATAVPLLPLDDALAVSKTGEIISARERRRQSTRRSESKRISANEKESMEMSSLVSNETSSGGHVWPKTLEPFISEAPLSSTLLDGHNNLPMKSSWSKIVLPSISSQTTTRSARKRRSNSRKQSKDTPSTLPPTPQPLLPPTPQPPLPSSSALGTLPTVPISEPAPLPFSPLPVLQSSLDDSTDGVTDLLRKKLELDDSQGNAIEEAGNNQDLALVTSGRPLPPIIKTAEKSQDLTIPPSKTVLLACTETQETIHTSTDLFSITVHGTDELHTSIHLTHPSVRISFIDISKDGALLKKSAPEKCVTSYYERGNPSVDYILPVLTQPYECRRHRALYGTLKAEWEEAITFNENIMHFTENEKVIIFFEIMDFVGSGIVSRVGTKGVQAEHKPWHWIAWAFLCPSGRTCKKKLGQKIRLQLYKYRRKLFQTTTESSEVYHLWSSPHRSTYPSTLYITLQSVPLASLLEHGDQPPQPVRRSMFPLQEEKGTITYEEMIQHLVPSISSRLIVHPNSALISASQRLPGEPCKIPLSILSTFYPTRNGCSSLAFSHSGHLLAAGCAESTDVYPLVLYKVPTFEPVLVLDVHRGIIYNLCWSASDNFLASASADRIVKVWCMDDLSTDPWATLPHPCYVYCVCFMESSSNTHNLVAATGAYDGYTRIWTIDEHSSQIVAELKGGPCRINCVTWCSKKSALYTGDSNGLLSMWQKKKGVWKLRKKLDLMKGQALSSICLHPNGRGRMLLHTLNKMFSMVDLRVDCVSCEYVGIALGGLDRCAALISPCGNLVFAGGSSGTIHVWNADTGNELHVYTELPFTSAIGALTYHPNQHVLIASAFGSSQPIVALNHVATTTTTSSSRSRPVSALPIGTSIAAANGIATIDSDPVVSQAQLRVSEKWKDLTKTLEKISTRKNLLSTS